MIEYLKEFNFASVCVRLLLALLAGGLIGFGRGLRKQTAGLRTYLITCVGAALATLIAFYLRSMLEGAWASLPAMASVKFDGSRFSAAVISGIGFLAAGSIMLVAHQQVSGLTTAIGLFITACIGIAAGSGYYEIVIVSVVCIVVVMEVLYPIEMTWKRKMRNMTIHVDFDKLENADMITDKLKEEGATIHEFELEDTKTNDDHPSAIISMKLSKQNNSHSSILSSVAELCCVNSVQELIS